MQGSVGYDSYNVESFSTKLCSWLLHVVPIMLRVSSTNLCRCLLRMVPIMFQVLSCADVCCVWFL